MKNIINTPKLGQVFTERPQANTVLELLMIEVIPSFNGLIDEVNQAFTDNVREVITEYITAMIPEIIYNETSKDMTFTVNGASPTLAEATNKLVETFQGGTIKISDKEARDLITAINEKIVSLLSSVDTLKLLSDPYRIFIGDSYGDASIINGLTWCDVVDGALDYRKKFIVKGGCGFGWGSTSEFNFLNLLNSKLAEIQDKGLVTEIYVIGGANDGNLLYDGTATTDNIRAGINAFVTQCKTSFPNAKIILGFAGRCSDMARWENFKTALSVWKEIADTKKCYFINGLEFSLHRDTLFKTGDILHPTPEGSKVIGRQIANFVKGGNVNVSLESVATFTKNIVLTNSPDFSIETYQRQGKSGIRMYSKVGTSPFYIPWSCNIPSVQAGGVVTLGTIANSCVTGGKAALTNCTVPAIVVHSGGMEYLPCQVIIQSGTLFLLIGTKTALTNVTAISLNNFSFEWDSLDS